MTKPIFDEFHRHIITVYGRRMAVWLLLIASILQESFKNPSRILQESFKNPSRVVGDAKETTETDRLISWQDQHPLQGFSKNPIAGFLEEIHATVPTRIYNISRIFNSALNIGASVASINLIGLANWIWLDFDMDYSIRSIRSQPEALKLKSWIDLFE